jgi:hypothetical protein
MTRSMASENITGKMGLFMRANFKMISSMVKE